MRRSNWHNVFCLNGGAWGVGTSQAFYFMSAVFSLVISTHRSSGQAVRPPILSMLTLLWGVLQKEGKCFTRDHGYYIMKIRKILLEVEINNFDKGPEIGE